MKKMYFLMLLFALVSLQLQGQTILSESFDNGIPEGWTIIDVDEDGNNWMWTSDIHGEGFVTSFIGYGAISYPDNWLITPSVNLPENSVLVFNLKASVSDFSNEYWGVYVSIGEDPFQALTESYYLPTEFENVLFDLSAYAYQTVRIAIRHYSNGGTYGGMDIDEVNIFETCPLTVYCSVEDVNRPLREESWLEIYTGENQTGAYVGGISYWDFYSNYVNTYNNYFVMPVQVPKNVPLYFTWHDPDTLNHGTWLNITDPNDERMVYSSDGREGEVARYTSTCGELCADNEKCPLNVLLVREPGINDYEDYIVDVVVDGMYSGRLMLSPQESSYDTTMMFCPGRSVELYVNPNGAMAYDFICYVTAPSGDIRQLNMWDNYYALTDVCAEQCDLLLSFGSSNSFQQNSGYTEPWLSVYAGNSQYPYMNYYWNDEFASYDQMYSIPVSANVPLRFEWHDPDPENHSVWFSIFDDNAGFSVFDKGSGVALANGQIATYTPTCGTGCVTEEQCPMQIHISRENSNEGASVVRYYGGGVENGEFILTSERNYVDTTLMLCEGRPFGMYTEQGGGYMWGYIIDAHGNETYLSDWIDYNTPDPCAQHCMLEIEIGAAEALSNIAEPHWLRIYAGEEELPSFNFNYSRWNYAGDRYWYQLPLTGSNDTLKFVWTEPDPTNYSSTLVIYDMKSGRQLLRKDEYTPLANGVVLEHVSTCELDPVYTMNVYNVEVISARVGMSVNSEGFENYNYNEEVSYGICWGTSTNPVVDQDNSLMRSIYEMGSQYFDEFELDNLTPNTTYFVRAFAIYQNELFYGNELSFTTKPCFRLTESYESVCDTFVMRLESQVMSEGFENGFPSGWTTVNVDGDSYNWNLYSGWSHTGNSSIYSYAQSNAQDNYLITPAIEVPADGQTSFSWWALKNSTASQHYEVYVSTSPDIADFGESVFSEEPGYSVFQQYSIDLDNWAGQTVYVAFRHNSSWYTYGIYLDDIEVKHSIVADILTESGDYVFTSPNEYGCMDTMLLHLTVRDNKPDVTTLEVNHVGVVSAIAYGELGQDCGNPVTESGICFSTTHNPTIQNNHVVNNEGIEHFELPLNGLDENTTYYVRAYATNSAGTMYGEEMTFTTLLWASLNGTVYNGTTHEPVPGAYVSIYNRGNNNSGFVTTVMADENGHYSVEGLTTEYYAVIATAAGYERYGVYPTLSAGANTVDVNIYYRSCQTPTDLSYELISGEQGTDLRLSWKMGGNIIRRCNSIQYNGAYGLGSNYSVGVYHLFTPEYLASYNGGAISSIGTWFTDDAEYATYTLRIWTGGTEENGPTTLAYEQVVNPAGIALNAWNDITLNTPFAIDGTQNLWIGFQVDCNAPSGNSVNAIGVTDSRYVYNSYGNILFVDNQWNTHTGLNYNWMIRATVVPNGLTYNVLANGQLVASNVTNTHYLVSPYIPQAEEVCYQVVTNCIKGRTSDTSLCATVLQTLPTVTTLNVSNITSNSATFSGELLSDGNAEVSERGFCWSTMAHPTKSDGYISVGENFMASIYLQSQTTYYVRAYATNSIGTAYGNEIEFTTKAECQAPYSFAVSEVGSSSALVSWLGRSYAEFMNYELSYKADGDADWTVISNIENEYYMLSGLTPHTTYTVRVQAICEPDNVSDYTDKSFTTSCVSGTEPVVVGTGTTTTNGANIPFKSYYNYSYSQQIYDASELNGAQTIDHLQLQYNSTQANTWNVDIYLGHTTKSYFSSTASSNWVPYSALELVYSGNITFDNSGENYWFDIPLDTPFEYNGSDNLVVVFDNNTNSYPYPQFCTHSVSQYRAMIAYSDYTNFDPSEMSSGGNSRYYYRNNLRIPGLCFSDGCERANVAVREITDSSATLLVAAAGTNDYELQYAVAGSYNYTTIENTISGETFALNGLTQNTRYEVRIRSLCANDSSNWKTAFFTTDVKRLDRLYVTSQGTGDGSSWETAANDLAWALNTAQLIYQNYGTMPDVWVAEGVYYGNTTSSTAFTLGNNSKLYGGFAGNESSLDDRDIAAHPTILDGQNIRQVLNQSTYNYNNSIVLDGLIIRNGYSGNSGAGAYLYGIFEVRNCDFINNSSTSSGGALYVGATGNFRNCRFMGNATTYQGGAVYDSYDYASYYNCKFSGNSANSYGGAALYGGRKLVNCEISGNTAYYDVLYNISDTLMNCSVVGNEVRCEGRSALREFHGALINTVVWGNTSAGAEGNISSYENMTVLNSAIEGGLAGYDNVINLQHDNFGNGNGLYYPVFVSPEVGDYRLQNTSALVDAGYSDVAVGSFDLGGLARVYGNAIDIGCYESHGEVYCSRPFNLAAQDATGSSVMLTWQNSNVDAPDHYEISYKKDGETEWTDVPGEIHDTYFLLGGLESQTGYAVQVRVFCDALAGNSANSEVLYFSTGCADQIVETVFGEGSTMGSSYLPVNLYYSSYSYSQQIFKASEIGEARTFDHIKIQYFYNSSTDRNLEIYLGHTDKSSFTSETDWIPNTDLVKVYDGTCTFTNTGEDYWLDIPFNQSFAYNGTQNLVVMFYDKSGYYSYNYGDKFYVHNTNHNNSIYASSYNEVDLSSLGYGSLSQYRSNLLIPGGCLPDGCPQANLVVEDVTDSSALVFFMEAPGSDGYELECREVGSESYESLITTSPYRWTGLRQNTEYELRIRSLCSDTASHWKTVRFTTPTKNLKHLYVTKTGTGDASSWQKASNDLAWTLKLAKTIKQQYGSAPEIWVAEGIYYGDSISDNAFTMEDGVNVYGGFAGDETENFDLSQRDFTLHATILDGQRSQRVLYQAANFEERTVWDGFTLRNGYVGYNNNNGYGGGAYLRQNATLSHCQLMDNTAQYGAGTYMASQYNSSENQALIDLCVVKNNTAYYTGGGVYALYSQVRNSDISYNTSIHSSGGGAYVDHGIVDHCVVTYNKSENSNNGGGLYVYSEYTSNPTVSNCLVAHNSAYYGGGIYSSYRSRIDNTTIVNNMAYGNGAGVYYSGYQSDHLMNNTVVWGNYMTNGTAQNIYQYPTFSHSAVEGGVEGDETVMVLQSANFGSESGLNYPIFVSPDNDDYRLRVGSALIDAGVSLENMPATDLAGEDRVYGETVDIGCYESHDEDYCTEPVAIAVQDVAGSSAMITWRNSNTNEPLYYQLSYKTEEATEWTLLPEQIQENHYMLTGLSELTSYMVRLRAVCEENKLSVFSQPVTFVTDCSYGSSLMTIGEGNGTSYARVIPVRHDYTYSYVQQIFDANEIGGARLINKLSLQYYYSSPRTYNMSIYMGHTSQSSVSSNGWVTTGLTQVFSGDITFDNEGEGNWFDIELNNGFSYNGTDNLVVIFDTRNLNNEYNGFYTHSTSMSKTLYLYSDYADYDIVNVNNYTGNTLTYRNNIRIPGACITGDCDRANVSVREVTANSALIYFVAGEGATGVQMEYCEAGSDHYISLPTASSPYLLTGLRQNMTYELRVRSICSGEENSNWLTRTFQTGVLNLNRLYVTTTGTGNGSSWDDAADDLSWALDVALRIKETYGTLPDIWVAQGTYYGDSISNNAFTMVEGVNVYGGFAGNEAANYDLSQRDFDAHATVLDGQHNQRVLYQPSNFDLPTTWDGFTIQNGEVTSNRYSYYDQYGGGAWLRGGSTLNHCAILHNYAYRYGGGLYCQSNDASDSTCLLNCSVSYNSSSSSGGGAMFQTYVVANNCSFTYNTSNAEGGGVYESNSYGNGSALSNCLIANNTSMYYGGGASFSSWNPRLVNTTIVNNTIASDNNSDCKGAGVYSHSSLNLYNCIVWGNNANGMVNGLDGNYTAYNVASDDGWTGENNIVLVSGNFSESVLAPRFVHPSLIVGATDTTSNADWHLSQGSVCVNHGDNSMATVYDKDGNNRVQQDIIDLGCYESPYTGVELPTYDSIIYVKEGGAGTRTGENWANAIGSVRDAVNLASMSHAKVWVAAGTYYGDGTLTNAFVMKPGVNVYGGFAGTEEPDFDLNLRNFEDYPTILDGQNVQRVLMQQEAFNENTAVVWDGFTIQNGRVYGNGGGVYMRSYSSLRNCIVRYNTIMSGISSYNYVYGAGVYARDEYGDYTTTISNCVITHNTAENMRGVGGGVYANNAVIDHTEISYHSDMREGGGLVAINTNVSNSLIHHNSARDGGGAYIEGGCQFVNCDIVSNTATNEGGAIYGYSYDNFVNCIIWGNKKNYDINNIAADGANFTYCAVEGGANGDNNITLASSNDGFDGTQNYVRFSDPVNGDYRLHPSSSCINIGNTEMVDDTLDLYGNNRLIGGIVDIGCSEVQEESSCVSVINLTVSNITTNSANLSWHPMGEESQWLVVYGEVDGDLSQTTVYDTICHLTGLRLNRNYMAKVRAICDENMSSIFSITVNFQTDCNPDQLDTLPNFSNMMPANNEIVYDKKVSFSWATMEHATSYDLYLWKESESEPSTPTYAGLVNPNLIDYTLPEYAPGNVYYWKVVAWNECINKTSQVMAVQVNWNADLHVSAVSTSSPLMSTQSMTVNWTVTNDGQGNTPPGVTWNDYIWITPVDGVGGGFWYNVAEKLLAIVPNQQSLAAGESYSNSVEVTLPAGDEYIGAFYLFVFTDQHDARDIVYPNGIMPNPYTPSVSGDPYPYLSGTVKQNVSRVPEDNENDNFFYKELTILPPPSPDLQISAINHSDEALSGQLTNVTWTVINLGEADAEGSWTDVVYLSRDTMLDTEDDYRVGRFVHSAVLPIGESYQKTAQFTIPVDFDGDYYFIVATDFNRNVYEGLMEENNRRVSTPMTVTMSWFTDLVVTSATINAPDNQVSASGRYNISYSVENQGMSPTNVNRWNDIVYISREPSLNRDNAIKLAIVRYTEVLNNDAFYNKTVEIRIPDTISGTWYLHVETDAMNDVYEHSVGVENLAEENNIYTNPQAITVLQPDLVVDDITVPEVINPNEPIRIQWTVRNEGLGNVVNQSFLDNIYCNDQLLFTANIQNVTILANEAVVRAATVQLPCVDGGTAPLTITTDVENRVREVSETNNSRTLALNFSTPDLAVSAVTPLQSVNDLNNEWWSGTSYELSYTVTNHGELTATRTDVVDKIYLSTSATSYQEEDLIYSYTHDMNLAADESETYTCTVTLPNGISGTYYYHVVCNADAVLCENGAMSDNTAVSEAVEVQLSPSPDLVITRLEAPEQVYLGASFNVIYTIKNQGTAPLVNARVQQKFYHAVSNIAGYDTVNRIATVYDYLSLAVNDSVTLVAQVTLPANLIVRNYYIYAKTDANDQIYEHEGEQNNVKVSNVIGTSRYQLDLQLTEIEGPDAMQWGQTATFRLHISNISSLPTLAASWQDVIYLSADDVFNNTDRLMQAVSHSTEVEAGDSYIADVRVTIPYGTTSPAYLIGITDINNANPETDISNNVLFKQLTINPVETPDLAISEVEVLDEVKSGQPARIAYKVTNVGEIDIQQQTWNDKLFVSYNNSYENTDLQLLTKDRRNMNLAQGEFYRDTLTFTVPLPYNGDMYLLLMANAVNNPYETVQDNNMAVQAVNVILPLPGDLVVTSVSCESSVVSGQMLHASWTIQNIGDNALSGNGLRSLVYVSADTTFDANDRMLGSVTSNNVNLDVDATMQQQLNARLSGVPAGNYYLIVKVDVTNAFNEVSDANNSGCTVDPFEVTIRPLPFNTDVYDTVSNNEVSDYMLTVGEMVNQTVRIHLTSEDSARGAVNMIYATYNGMGNNLNYSYATVGQYTANSELYIPATQQGYYGVNIYGSTPTNQPQNMVVRADILPFELRAVNDNHGGNTGAVTVELTGSRLRPDMAVCLYRDNEVITADTLIYVNYYQVFVRFDLTGHTPGVYNVKAENFCEGSQELANAFTVENGQPSGLAYNLLFPSSPRPNRNIVMMLEYGNIGNVDLHNQVLEITSLGHSPISLTPEGIRQNRTTLQVPLSIDGEPDGLLRPGSYGTINIYTYSSGALIFTIKPVEE